MRDLSSQIIACLTLSNPGEKCQATRHLFANLTDTPAATPSTAKPPTARAPAISAFTIGENLTPPDTPGRLPKPELIPPAQVPKRTITAGPKGRFALLHALAHIELNAVNLALDIAVRFGAQFGPDFVRDWLSVADDEAKHFLLLQDRLSALDGAYGDLPAHDGLWMSAIATKDSALARLAVVPMVLEARGLDVTPAMINKLTAVGDLESVAALKIIYEDEVGHVAVGRKWFEHACTDAGLEPEITWQEQVKAFFHGVLKRPFNEPARTAAGMGPAYYEPLADWYEAMGF